MFWFWVWDIRNISANTHPTFPADGYLHTLQFLKRRNSVCSLTKKTPRINIRNLKKINQPKYNFSWNIFESPNFCKEDLQKTNTFKNPAIRFTTRDSPWFHHGAVRRLTAMSWAISVGIFFWGGKKQNSLRILQIFPGKYGGGKYMEIWHDCRSVFLGLNWFRTVWS